jgi:type VI secretion system secreted protein VgrG
MHAKTKVAPKAIKRLNKYYYPLYSRNLESAPSRIVTKHLSEQSQAHYYHGKTNQITLMPGVRFKFSGQNEPDLYFITQRRVSVKELATGTTNNGGTSESFNAEFTVVNTDVSFAPPHSAIKPTIKGVHSATVVGPPNQSIYQDKLGRIKVYFPWDIERKPSETSSCWLRVSQKQAGNNSGHLFIPRVGHEVLVGFLEGDPDRPFVTNSAYNLTHKSAYDFPTEKRLSGFKTQNLNATGHNELSFDATNKQEAILIHAQNQLTHITEKNTTEKINKNSHTNIIDGNLQNTTQNGQHTVTANNYLKLTVQGSQLEIKPDGIHINASVININPTPTGNIKTPSPKLKHSWLGNAFLVLGLIVGIAALIPLDETGAA